MSVKSRPGLGLQRHRGLFPLEKRPERQSRLLMLGSINSDPLSEPLQQDKCTRWRHRRSFDCDFALGGQLILRKQRFEQDGWGAPPPSVPLLWHFLREVSNNRAPTQLF